MLWSIAKDSRELRYDSGDYSSDKYDFDKAAKDIAKWDKENK